MSVSAAVKTRFTVVLSEKRLPFLELAVETQNLFLVSSNIF